MYYKLFLPLTQNTIHQHIDLIISVPSSQLYPSLPIPLYSSNALPHPQQNIQMTHNQSSQSHLPLSQSSVQARAQFIKKINFFIVTHAHRSPPVTRYVRNGYGFILDSTYEDPTVLAELVTEIFGCTLQELTRQAQRFGFNVRTRTKPNNNKKSIVFISQQRLTEELSGYQASLDDSLSEEEDEFPKEEEVEEVRRQKEQKSRSSAFVRPSIMFSKVQSQGNISAFEPRKDDASIEVKLNEQELCLSPKGRTNRAAVRPAFGRVEPNTLLVRQRIEIEKDNYEKCSKLIDGTIISLLEAHRCKKMEERKDGLMEKVVEIYDMLSNSIENSSTIHKMFKQREIKMEERAKTEQKGKIEENNSQN